MYARRIFYKMTKTNRYISSLSHIPSVGAVPFLGSAHKISNLRATDGRKLHMLERYDVLHNLYKQHGPVYTVGFPGMGVGLKQLVVKCAEPEEFVKVVQNEGRNPTGGIQFSWAFAGVNKLLGTSIQGFFTQGEDWRRLRQSTQKSLISLSTVNDYTGGMCEAAADASTVFKSRQDQVGVWNNHCAFDVFCTVAFGQVMHITTGETNSANKLFCENAAALLADANPLMYSLKDHFMYRIGWPTERFKLFLRNWEALSQHSQKLVGDFLERRSRGELNEFEAKSYMAANIRNSEKSETALTQQEFKEMTTLLLMASVDTTSGILGWLLIHLALYPEVQAKVREEILSCVSQNGSPQELSETLIKGPKKLFPYLSAVIRESHRVRPAFPEPTTKTLHAEVELLGYKVPAGVPVSLDIYSLQNDPDIVENAHEFRPERWLKPAVEARKGSRAEVIDHYLMKDSFSAGARMCPGSRVARVEIYAIAATLVRKYEFSLAPDQGIKSVYDVEYRFSSTCKPIQIPKFIVKKL